jgi:hypothetical protein
VEKDGDALEFVPDIILSVKEFADAITKIFINKALMIHKPKQQTGFQSSSFEDLIIHYDADKEKTMHSSHSSFWATPPSEASEKPETNTFEVKPKYF